MARIKRMLDLERMLLVLLNMIDLRGPEFFVREETMLSAHRLGPTGWLCTRVEKMPRACPVEFSCLLLFSFERETSTAQGRGIQLRIEDRCSDDREVPRDKPVASFFD